MTEYRNVLNRDKFKRFHDFTKMALYVLDDIENHADFYKTTTTFNLIKDDSDNRLLELAHECNADYLITGNTNDFIMPSFNDTIIISPKGYWEIHNP